MTPPRAGSLRRTRPPPVDRLAFVFSLLALVLALIVMARQMGGLPGTRAEAAEVEEIAHHMAYFQRYAEKLHHAGMAGNAALAGFYLEEIEEVAETVKAGNYVEGGRELTPMVDRHLLPAVAGLERAVEAHADSAAARAAFDAAYARLVLACNTCHVSARHGFVRIRVPEGNSYPNQAFTPAGAGG